IKGCNEIVADINIDFDFICCPCGTGATLTGIILSLKNDQKAIGFQVLKAENYIRQEVEKYLERSGTSIDRWSVNEDYHFGGYAKTKPELINFITQFEKQNKIPLDYVYTGKMISGIYDLIKKEYFKPGQTIIAIHTGGLQGNTGFKLT
ncbi:MAG: 1-aminocyclopropane-1-carboxylate deaminase/D-cysteine desulfhydrase, partial [Bacteroidia bacterium]